uniref:Uncharacterized protein n=1 Tax=Panagrolaimus sp. ES5 TaxID=591445 RepID=A0AC34GRR6_9BILA
MEKSQFQYNGRSMGINVHTVTPKQLGIVFRISNIEQKMLQDEEGSLHVITKDRFDPKLEPQKTYFFVDLDDSNQQQQNASENPQNFHDNSSTNHADFYGQKPTPQENNQREQLPPRPQHQQKASQVGGTQAIVLQDNKAYLKSGKIFFENIANGCVAIEELVLLSASAPDVKLADNSSLRVSIFEAIRALGKAYTDAGNTVNEIKLRFNEIPTSIRQGLEAFSQQQDTHRHLQTLQNLVKTSIEAAEAKINLFKSPQSEFLDLEYKVKTAEKEEALKNKSERSKQSNGQMEMKKIENALQQKENEIKNLDFSIRSLEEEIKAFERESARKKEKGGKGLFGGNKNGSQNDELQRQQLQQQQSSARKQKHQLENEIDDLEEKKIVVKHQSANAKTEPSTNWEKVNGSLNKVIFQIGEIDKTWKLLLNFIKTIEAKVKEMQRVASSGNSDNSLLINAALQSTLNAWVICQCCEIYDDIVKAYVVPLVTGVTSNYGLSLEDAQSKLTAEKTKAQNVKNEIANIADKRLLEAVNNLATVSANTEEVFTFIFSTA